MSTEAATSRAVEPTDGELLGQFLDQRDAVGQAAFAQLVQRHAAMVLAVCRSVLRSEADAEDAAQAAFLTLARKAPSLRHYTSLAGWLHRVAWFAASHARRAALVRQHHEQEAARMNPLTTPSEPQVPTDLVHESLAGLPEKYRLPMVLHYIEHRDADEMAALLGISPGALAMRLTRGREKLRCRLASAMRDTSILSVTAVLGAVGEPASAQIPAAFVNLTTQNAAAALAGEATSTSVMAISKGAIHMLFMAKMKLAAMVTAVVLLLGGAAGIGLRLAFAGPGSASPRAASYPVDKASTQPVSITASSFLGGDGDSVRGARIQSDGSIVLAANLAAAQIAGTEIALIGVDAKARGCVLRLGPDGQKVLAAVRIADAVSDLAIDEKDAIYVAAGVRGAIKLSPGANQVLWTRDVGGPCVRIDAAADGHCVAVAAGKGVTLLDPDGKELGRGFGRTNTADACIDGASRTIVTVGFRQARAHVDGRGWPVQICYALGLGYDGKQKWCDYDWSTDRDSDRFINKSGNNMADTRGYRCAIGRDGKLYCAFESAGGNHIFRYSPTNIMEPVKLVGGDQYHQFHASAAEHKSVLLKFDAATGKFLQGQQFCPRRENGRAGNSRVKDGDIAADADGRLLLAGYADPNLPLSVDPCPPEQPRGGAYLLALSPDMALRLVCTRMEGSAQQGISSACCVDARKVGDRWVVVYGGFGAKAGMHTASPLQKQATGLAGFFAILVAQSAR